MLRLEVASCNGIDLTTGKVLSNKLNNHHLDVALVEYGHSEISHIVTRFNNVMVGSYCDSIREAELYCTMSERVAKNIQILYKGVDYSDSVLILSLDKSAEGVGLSSNECVKILDLLRDKSAMNRIFPFPVSYVALVDDNRKYKNVYKDIYDKDIKYDKVVDEDDSLYLIAKVEAV